jgi:hypothetical protein
LRAILALARMVGAALERGRQSARTAPAIADEPLAHDALADYRYAAELMLRRRDNERDRLDRIESKIAPIIGGTIAALGLFIDKASSTIDLVTGSLYLIPLFMLLRTFETYEYIDVPDPDVFVQSWQRWPQTFLKSVFEGTADAISRNGPTIDAKARNLNTAMRWVYGVTVIVIGVRLLEVALPKGVWIQGINAVASRAASVRASSGARPIATSTPAGAHGKVRPTTHP